MGGKTQYQKIQAIYDYMGSEELETWETWETSGLKADEVEVNECLKWSLMGGSALGVLCTIEHRGLYPSEMA